MSAKPTNGDFMDRVPPQNLEAEQSVLGSMILDMAATRRILGWLSPSDFYREAHQRIFAAMEELDEAGINVDLVMLAERLRAKDMLDSCGGTVYLTTLLDAVPTAANAENYARVVEDKSIRRREITLLHQATENAYEPDEAIHRREKERVMDAYAATKPKSQEGDRSALTILEDLYAEALSREERVELRGITSGWPSWDRLVNGFLPGLYILAARPSDGKSAMALSVAQHACRTHCKALDRTPYVLFLSNEMPVDQLVMRLMSQTSGIPLRKLSNETRADWEENRLGVAVEKLHDAMKSGRLRIEHASQPPIGYYRRRAREAKAKGELDFLIIDYANLIEIPGLSDDQVVPRNKRIAADIKGLSLELGIPVLLLNQLKRPKEDKNGRVLTNRPTGNDLAESDDYLRHVDVLMLLWHPGREDDDPDDDSDRDVEMLIAKNRNGERDRSIPLRFRPSTTLFYDPANDKSVA